MHIHLKALEALHTVDGKLPINVKVIIEGEEAVSYTHLDVYKRQYSHQTLLNKSEVRCLT